jgi:enoyl-[acyl-carrier protein] reductase I
MSSLAGKKGLIIGIANDSSIAYGCAQACKEQGAELAATYLNEKALKHVQPLADHLNIPSNLMMPFDIMAEGQVEAVFENLKKEWGTLDFVVHAMASATKDMVSSRLVDVKADDFNFAMRVSCHSFLQVAQLAEPLMQDNGGTLVTMTYLGSHRAVENYGFMGPMKAALESCATYMASELGPQNIRVHAVSPGTMMTRAASGIQNFDKLIDINKERSPLKRLCGPSDVGAMTAFLVGPGAQNMTGGIHYVDAGYNTVG